MQLGKEKEALIACQFPLDSHSASFHPGVQMGTSKYAGGNPAMD